MGRDRSLAQSSPPSSPHHLGLLATRALRLPTFEFDIAPLGGGGPNTLLKRMALYVESGTIKKVWYPVFPPDRNAADVLEWLSRT